MGKEQDVLVKGGKRTEGPCKIFRRLGAYIRVEGSKKSER